MEMEFIISFMFILGAKIIESDILGDFQTLWSMTPSELKYEKLIFFFRFKTIQTVSGKPRRLRRPSITSLQEVTPQTTFGQVTFSWPLDLWRRSRVLGRSSRQRFPGRRFWQLGWNLDRQQLDWLWSRYLHAPESNPQIWHSSWIWAWWCQFVN